MSTLPSSVSTLPFIPMMISLVSSAREPTESFMELSSPESELTSDSRASTLPFSFTMASPAEEPTDPFMASSSPESELTSDFRADEAPERANTSPYASLEKSDSVSPTLFTALFISLTSLARMNLVSSMTSVFSVATLSANDSPLNCR